MQSAPTRVALAFAGIAALTVSACGQDATTTASPSPAATATTAAPATASAAPTSDAPATATPATSPSSVATTAGDLSVVDTNGDEVILAAPAEAIVSLSPTATESLFAIGAGDQVVAVDEYSYYPEEAPVTDLSGFTPNAEAVADYGPDLVVIQNDANDLVAQLDALDIPTLVQGPATTLDDVFTQIEMLGVATGHVDDAAELVTSMRSDLDDLVATAPDEAAGMTYFHEISTDYFTTSSAGFVGAVYGLFDLVNIADEAAEAAGTEYPQMAEEAILAADPDLVYTTSGATPEDVAARPGWSDVTAVANGDIVQLDGDIASRWGPRIVDFAAVVAESLATAGAQ